MPQLVRQSLQCGPSSVLIATPRLPIVIEDGGVEPVAVTF